LQRQHLFTIIKFLFLRLSKVKILPRAADQVKKAALGGAWDRHTHFHGNRVPPAHIIEPKNDFTLNTPFLDGTHIRQSALSIFTLVEPSHWKKEAKTSTSQSWASLKKLTFHW